MFLPDDYVQRQKTHCVDNASGDDWPEGVRQTVGNVRDGVDGTVDGYVAGVHDVAEQRQQAGVDEGNAET